MSRHTVDSLQAIGIAPWAVLVTLNGDPVSGCVAVDEDAGYVERYARTLTSLKGASWSRRAISPSRRCTAR